MRMFMPGDPPGLFTYDLENQEPGTLCWYHPHTHELTGEQVWGGLHGPLLIDDPPDAPSEITDCEQHVLVLKDISIVGGEPAPHSSMMDYMHGKEGDMVMVNGQVNPRADRCGRARCSAGASSTPATPASTSSACRATRCSVIGTDGGLLDKPYAQSYVMHLARRAGRRAGQGERARRGNYKLLALPYSRMGMMTLGADHADDGAASRARR